jgi:hypothetical protein
MSQGDAKHCLVDECGKAAFCKGMCEYHYRLSRIAFRNECSEAGCEGKVVARGLCRKHYAASRHVKVRNGVWNPHDPPGCKVFGCLGKHLAKGMCQKHYSEEIRKVNREFLKARYFPDGIRCRRCGKEFEWRQMDAHHLDPTMKEHLLSEIVNNSALIDRPELIRELDECEMMCARCHQNLHGDPRLSHEMTYQRKDKGRRIDEMKTEIRKVAGESCFACGDWLYPKEMEFHHRPGEEKIDDVSTLMLFGSLAEVMAEADKCDVVCRNCHRVAA